MIDKSNEPINLLDDGDYVIQYGVYRYVVRDSDTSGLYKKADVEVYLADHPEALILEPTPPEPTIEEKAANARRQRNALLAASDWTQVADVPVDQAAWKLYRQALRDWPKTNGFPDIATIPKAPSK